MQDSLLFFKERFNLNVSALHNVVVEVNEPIKNITRLCLEKWHTSLKLWVLNAWQD